MKEQIRLKRFIVELDQLLQDCEYHDDETGEDVCDVTEEECYDSLMKTEEYHLLGAEKVKSFIHLFITDYSSRVAILTALNLL